MKAVIFLAIMSLIVAPNALASGSKIKILAKKDFLGAHIIVNKNRTMTLYEADDLREGKVYKASLSIDGSRIRVGPHRPLQMDEYGKVLNEDMEAYGKHWIRPGENEVLELHLAGSEEHYLAFTTQDNPDFSLSSFLGPCSGLMLTHLGYGFPKAALLLSKNGNNSKVVIVIVSCGNNDCVTGLVVVEGPVSRCFA